MSTFGLRVSNTPEAQKWADETAERLKGDSLVTNPFKGYLVRVDKKDNKLLLVVKMEPVYPDVSIWGAAVILGIYVMFGVTAWMLLPSILFLPKLLNTSIFYFLVSKKALLKRGYKGDIKLVSKSDIIDEVI
jgi:hypothetical protein